MWSAVVWYLLAFNGLVQARNAVDQAWSNIEVELKRRLDLISNLVETVRGYAKHGGYVQIGERKTESSPSICRCGLGQQYAAGAGSRDWEHHGFGGELSSAPGGSAILNLQGELSETENRIAVRRHAYNQTVNRYLNLCGFIPSNIVSWIHEFPEKAFFDAPTNWRNGRPR